MSTGPKSETSIAQATKNFYPSFSILPKLIYTAIPAFADKREEIKVHHSETNVATATILNKDILKKIKQSLLNILLDVVL
jgi:hypothetical protein